MVLSSLLFVSLNYRREGSDIEGRPGHQLSSEVETVAKPRNNYSPFQFFLCLGVDISVIAVSFKGLAIQVCVLVLDPIGDGDRLELALILIRHLIMSDWLDVFSWVGHCDFGILSGIRLKG